MTVLEIILINALIVYGFWSFCVISFLYHEAKKNEQSLK